MFDNLLQLVILFAVIFDPLASLAVFFTAASNMKKKQMQTIATLSVTVAAGLSLLILLFGNSLLNLFNTDINEFKVAGGIILSILGVKMALGHPLTNLEKVKNNSEIAIAAIISTPLLTGPAAITAIIILTNEYGMATTGLAVAIVLAATAILFYQAEKINKRIGKTAIQVISTILGMVTLSWGINFIVTGLRTVLNI